MQLNYRCSCLFPLFPITSIDLKLCNPLKMSLEDCEWTLRTIFVGICSCSLKEPVKFSIRKHVLPASIFLIAWCNAKWPILVYIAILWIQSCVVRWLILVDTTYGRWCVARVQWWVLARMLWWAGLQHDKGTGILHTYPWSSLLKMGKYPMSRSVRRRLIILYWRVPRFSMWVVENSKRWFGNWILAETCPRPDNMVLLINFMHDLVNSWRFIAVHGTGCVHECNVSQNLHR